MVMCAFFFNSKVTDIYVRSTKASFCYSISEHLGVHGEADLVCGLFTFTWNCGDVIIRASQSMMTSLMCMKVNSSNDTMMFAENKMSAVSQPLNEHKSSTLEETVHLVNGWKNSSCLLF